MSEKETWLHNFGINSQTRVIALVGAGGKTSLMYALAREFMARHETVITTTTTKIFPPALNQSPELFLVEEHPDLEGLPERLSRWGHITVGRSIVPPHGKLDGIPEATIARLLDISDKIIVEADGAAGRSIKAPEDWEPVIPSFTNLVIPVVGLNCIGKPAQDDLVFRIEKFLALTELRRGQSISPESVARLLSSNDGALKGIGPNAEVVPFLNKLDLLVDSTAVQAIIRGVRERTNRIQRIVAGKLKNGPEVICYALADLS
jgi:probable selenium-dependent hydroxylase accessory protein YqeC